MTFPSQSMQKGGATSSRMCYNFYNVLQLMRYYGVGELCLLEKQSFVGELCSTTLWVGVLARLPIGTTHRDVHYTKNSRTINETIR